MVSLNNIEELTDKVIRRIIENHRSSVFPRLQNLENYYNAKNIINNKQFLINTPDVSIKVNPERSDLIETRIIGGVKYILICADENVEVNGENIHIGAPEPATV